MSSTFDKLNLKPQERRLVVIVGLVVFFVLNLWFVWPRFGEWGRLQVTKKQLGEDLFRFEREAGRIQTYQRELQELQKQGAAVPSEDQALNLAKTVNAQAVASGVQIQTYSPGRTGMTGTQTNSFFEEQNGVISINTEEKSLVDFLYNLGVGDSLIRVRSMNLSPDPSRMRLAGSLTLVASYPKKAPARPAAVTNTAASAKAPPAKAVSPLSKTNAPAPAARK